MQSVSFYNFVKSGTVRGKNNLGSGFHNTYWKVTKGFEVYARVGVLQNLGAYSVTEPVFKKMKIKKGDFIHDLHGGVFSVSKAGIAKLIRIYVDGKEQLYPLSCLKLINEDDATRPDKYLNDEFHHIFKKEELSDLGLFVV